MANTALTEAVYYILLSLLTPMHGYGIMQNTESLSGGRVKLAAGTLYGAINSLLGLFDNASLEESVRRHIPAGTEELNLKALHAGMELVS